MSAILAKLETAAPEVQWRMLTDIARSLALEVNTPDMRAFRKGIMTPMDQAKDVCGTAKRTKRGVLKDYVKWYQAQYPGCELMPSVKLALSK
jgi:hypothetical protein